MVCLLCSVLHIIDVLRPLLMFTHVSIIDAQYWRLLTHSLVHTNTPHLLLNISGALLLWALHGEYYNSKTLFGLFSFSAIFSSGLVWLFAPHIDNYMGLSAVLHGLFVYGACQDLLTRRLSGVLLLGGLSVKLYLEQVQGASQTADLINATVAYDAHIYGAIAGLLYAALQRLMLSRNSLQKSS